MEREKFNMAWDLMVELRKELINAQLIRAQVMGFKITFVTVAIGLIAANANGFKSQLFFIPAFAAIFFDFLIQSFSFSIKRIGYYCRAFIEPILKEYVSWTGNFWEEFVALPENKQILATAGHIGITSLAVVLAIFAAYPSPQMVVLFSLCLLFFALDILSYRLVSQKFG